MIYNRMLVSKGTIPVNSWIAFLLSRLKSNNTAPLESWVDCCNNLYTMFPGEQKIQFLSSQEYESLEKDEGWDENGRLQISKITELPEIFGVYISFRKTTKIQFLLIQGLHLFFHNSSQNNTIPLSPLLVHETYVISGSQELHLFLHYSLILATNLEFKLKLD